ncbi:MAG: hypothetical protein P8074_02515 [Anaerolineales bacterium]|jgi:hypothetical protein
MSEETRKYQVLVDSLPGYELKAAQKERRQPRGDLCPELRKGIKQEFPFSKEVILRLIEWLQDS